MNEFDCEECKRHIVDLSGQVREYALCAECLHLPDWFNDPTLAAILDPGYVNPDVAPLQLG